MPALSSTNEETMKLAAICLGLLAAGLYIGVAIGSPVFTMPKDAVCLCVGPDAPKPAPHARGELAL